MIFPTLILAKQLVVCNLRAAPLELQVCMATRSPCEDQALPLRGPLPLVPRAVSPHRGNLVALSLSFIIEGRCLQAGQRHGPRRIAQHPEQSEPLPLFGAHASVARNRKGKKQIFLFTRLSLYLQRMAFSLKMRKCLRNKSEKIIRLWINITKKTR